MPIRVKSRVQHNQARAASPNDWQRWETELPDIARDDTFRDVVAKLSSYIADTVYMPSTFEQLRTTAAGDPLRTLVDHLETEVLNPAIVNALLALRWHYGIGDEDRGLGEARGNACEIVAWRFLTRLSEREAVEFCLYEIPHPREAEAMSRRATCPDRGETNERTSLLHGSSSDGPPLPTLRPEYSRTGSQKRIQLLSSLSKLTMDEENDEAEGFEEGEADPTAPFIHLNALEIAAIADAKRFLSQHVVQKIVTGIWSGEIIFWDHLSVHSVKKPRFYNPHTSDPFCRLRVPKYLKAYEVLFFCIFLFLYYGVLIQQNREQVTGMEAMLYVWIVAFLYDEVSEYIDAGSIFYAADIWNLFDMTMITIGVSFAIMRLYGLYTENWRLIDTAFDVLSLEALFMVPRICSVLSLSPYWGTLVPCLKEMGKDFVKFMVLVVIVYIGFLTTFTLVGRDSFTFPHMAMIVTKIFYGSSYVGFDVMEAIDPIFGPPLMFIFVTLSSILLMGSLTGMLSNSFSRVISHAREEYLYVYSVYVLEASTSNRLTHFYPPFNILAALIFRPLRLFLRSNEKFRQGRILLLKATHLPIVLAIKLYELLTRKFFSAKGTNFSTISFGGARQANLSKRRLAPPPDHAGRRRPRSGDVPPPSTLSLSGAGPSSSSGGEGNGNGGSGSGNGSGGNGDRTASQNGYSRGTRRRVGHGRRDSQVVAEDDLQAPTDADVRIAELSLKIDRLTDMIAGLQQQAGEERYEGVRE